MKYLSQYIVILNVINVTRISLYIFFGWSWLLASSVIVKSQLPNTWLQNGR